MRDDLKDAVSLFYKESRMKTTKPSYKHLVLILDKHLQHLPWESLAFLREFPISRMPSLSVFAKALKDKKCPLEKEKIFYVLNPSGDLVRTEKQFSNIVSNWQGITGREPSREEFQNGLKENDVFLYFGHGGGEAYIDVYSISKIPKLPVILLFGCSSGRLKLFGEFDPHGIACEYLISGSPAVLGNLWDVTDIDLDKFSESVLNKWISSKMSLFEAVAKSRSVCNLKSIVGASPIIYGLP
jgi:separase